jgi:Flp pilus assembly protein TadG
MIRFARLARDDRGASIIELALVAPVLASLLIGMVDLSRAYSYKLKLEQAAQRAIEKVQAYQTSTSTYGTLQSEAAAAAGVPTSNVTIDYWLECDGTRAASYESVCAGGQTYGRWISVTVQGTFTPMFRSKYYPRANSDGTFTIQGKTGMRTQ